mmetsp:Transcript_56282/g.68811  ORF Transcript_56282/g.68811 Transcript_56282/m.68811 type:complete len:223 (+) Transcript_56282:45-713(+)
MALVKPVKDLDSLNKNVSLQLAIKQEYPNVYKLIQYNSKGTWKYLEAKGIVKQRKPDIEPFAVSHSGTDNWKAWSDYKKAVDKFLTSINNEDRLQHAREKIANKIKDEHYRVFPRWPSVGDKSQTAFVNITTYDGYKYEDEYVAYACEGSVQVTDKRPSKYEYYAEFHGRPILKQLFINLPMLKGVELACIRSWEMATQKADKYAKKKLTKAICFDFSDDDE